MTRTWPHGAIRLRGSVQGVSATEPRAVGVEWAGLSGVTPLPAVRAPMIPNVPRISVGVLGFAFGAIACAALVVVEWAAWTMVTPGRRLGTAEVRAGPNEAIETRAGDGTRLAGIWVPAKAGDGKSPGRKGTVVLLHGFAEPPSAMNGRVEALARCGWDVAAIDLRGYGRSEGGHSTFGGREAGDLRAWIDALAGRIGPGAVVAVWGRSMGAAIALRAAAEDPRIAALVLEAPYLDLEETLAALLRRFRLPLPRPLARLALARARSLAGVSLTRPRPIDLAPRVATPTLIVHGSDDRLIPLSDARRLAEAFPRPALLIDVAGAGHTNAVDVGGDELLVRIATFLGEAVPR